MNKTEQFPAEFIDIYLRLETAMKEPHTLLSAMKEIGREHHIAPLRPKKKPSRRTYANDEVVKRDIEELSEVEVHQLTAFIVRECVQGVLLLQLNEGVNGGMSFAWFGRSDDIEFISLLRNVLVAVIEDYFSSLKRSEPNLVKHTCTYGILWELTRQLLFKNAERRFEDLVQRLIADKEVRARQGVEESGLKPSSINLTPWSSRVARENSDELGRRLMSNT